LLFQSILQKYHHLMFLWYALFTFTFKNLDILVIFSHFYYFLGNIC
jgi:hypothetical protein